MHERGACGCEVNFPGMQGPRLVQPGWKTGAGTSTAGRDFSGQGIPPTGNNGGNGQPTQSGGSSLPLFQENYVDGVVQVSVRLSSLYAAEWNKDHAKRHESGKCKCPVSFERYKPYDIENNQGKTPWYPIVRLFPTNTGTSDEDDGAMPDPTHNTHGSFGDDRTPVGHVARWAGDGPPGYLMDKIVGPVRPDASTYGGRPVDIQTVHYPGNDGLPIAGNPIVCGPFEQTELPSIVEFQQPEVNLAGFPIGAGPEGGSHAGDWETCSLNIRNSPTRRRRLSSEF